jgi:hypothetical protein
MRKVGANITHLGRAAVLGAALLALGGCADNSGNKNAGAQAAAATDASPAAAKKRIARMCMQDPEKFFGAGKETSQARCDCYGAGVARTFNKDELSYIATYNEIPFTSSTEYDKIKQRCIAGGSADIDDKKPAVKTKTKTKKKEPDADKS